MTYFERHVARNMLKNGKSKEACRKVILELRAIQAIRIRRAKHV